MQSPLKRRSNFFFEFDLNYRLLVGGAVRVKALLTAASSGFIGSVPKQFSSLMANKGI